MPRIPPDKGTEPVSAVIGLSKEGSGARPVLALGAGVRTSRQAAYAANALVFEDPASILLKEKLDRLAPSDATVLVIGETGTGKELVSRYIHAQSQRQGRPFIAVNCGALTDSLAEAELFGHEKGAFTGAIRTQPGWFEAAQGGTLLLDEVGDLPLPLQVKLLRVLQEREVTRVGARSAIPIDVRVIAATNVNLEEAVAAKRFREDLYFRLNVASVTIPPLRARIADIEPLAIHFLDLYKTRFGKPDVTFGAGALDLLRRHAWPGNIRELENAVQNALLLAAGSVIEDIDLHLTRAPPLPAMRPPETLEDLIRPLIEKQIVSGTPDIFDRVTRVLVQSAFALADGNQVRAADYLGISRNALRTQLSHLGVIPPRQRPASPYFGRAARSAREVRVGFQKYGMLTILKARRALENRLSSDGISVSWTEYPAGPQLLDALRSGQIDFGTTGETPPVFAQAAGTALLYVGYEPPAPSGEALVVPSDSPIRTVADLKGKTVALNKASNVHYLLVRALEAHGLSLRDIKPVYLVPDERVSAFGLGGTDAWALWDPLLTAAQQNNDVRVLLDGTGLVANHQFHLASRDFARDHAETIPILLNELRNTGRYAVEHPAETAHFLSPEMGIDKAALEIAIARLTYGAMPMNHDVVAEQQKIADRFYALGLIPKAISIRDALWTPNG